MYGDTKEQVMAKVRKLLRLSQSSNANEAALAAANAQALLDKHQLDSALLALDSADPVRGMDDEPIMDFGDAPLDEAPKLDRWRGALAMWIAKLNGCGVYHRGGSLFIFGRPSDADAARYLYAYVSREVERLASENGAGKGRTWRNNFRLGVVETVNRKLRAQRDQFKRDARAETGVNETALVRVNAALARIEQHEAAVVEFGRKALHLRAGSSGGRSRYNGDARAQGRKAGESINVNGSRASLASGQRRIGQ